MESYNRDPESLEFPFDLGIPDWVFWGIVIPWCICIVLSLIYCIFIFAEDDLNPEDPTSEMEGG